MRFVFAEVAQLIEHQPSKLRVASLSLVFRSTTTVTRLLGEENVLLVCLHKDFEI